MSTKTLKYTIDVSDRYFWSALGAVILHTFVASHLPSHLNQVLNVVLIGLLVVSFAVNALARRALEKRKK